MADDALVFEPDVDAPERDVDIQLRDKLTGKVAVEDLATALRNASFAFEPDDYITIATADELKIDGQDEYVRGYELLRELTAIEDRIVAHYNRFDKPLNFLIGVVRKLKGPQAKEISPVKQALSKRLGAWKTEQDRLDAERRRKEQDAADAAAKVAQQAKADALERVADAEVDPALAASFRVEADSVRQVDTRAAPVPQRSSVPKITGGFTRTTWRCEFVNVKALMTAWVEGKCFIPDDAIINDLQGFMDDQAAALMHNLGNAYPGTRAISTSAAATRRGRK